MLETVLLLTVVLPLVGAGMCWAMSDAGRGPVRAVALVTALLTLLTASVLVWHAPTATGNTDSDGGAGEFVVFNADWLTVEDAGIDIRFSLGLDGLSLWMFGLTTLLVVTAVLVSWDAVDERPAGFYSLLLLLETGLLGVFAARDLLLFYVFFEFTLIPLFFLIGIWGSEERRYAARKFFLFTFAGSVLTFLGLLAIVIWVHQHPLPEQDPQWTFSISGLQSHLAALQSPEAFATVAEATAYEAAWPTVQFWIFLALFAGFAVKVPLFPLHTWLPLAHVQAPAAGSVLLAGVLLKIGTYGFVRFSVGMLPDATVECMPWVLYLSVAGIIYGALVALAQSDMKRLIAYSSVSHLGFCMLGIFALNRLGMQGGVLQMINHGISTGALFAIVGMIYARFHTRKIAELGGLARRMPWLAFFLVLFTFSSIGLPGLNGFAGELLLLVGMFQRGWPAGGGLALVAVLAVAGVVLGAWYMLWLVQRIMFGPVRVPKRGTSGPTADLRWYEFGALAPLAVFVVWIGIQPQFFLARMSATLDPIVDRVQRRYDDMPETKPAVAAVPGKRTGRNSGGPHAP